MTTDMIEFNKDAARKLADEKGFELEDILVCIACGRTVVRSQHGMSNNVPNSIYCTCEKQGPPMVNITEENND